MRCPRLQRLPVRHAQLTPWEAQPPVARLAELGGGLLGVARAGISAATSGLRVFGDSAAEGLAERIRAGERAGWTATGGSPIGENGESAGSVNRAPAPGWARQLRREQMMRSVEREAGGAGLKPNLRGEDQ